MNELRLVSWNLTRRCNLACGHCYIDAVRRSHADDGELSTAEATALIEQLVQLAPGAMVVLTGGEPLLRPDLIDLVRAVAAQGLMPVIGTNGVMLDTHRAARLRDAGAAGVGISVDSVTPEFHDRLRGRRNAWDAAVRGILAARDAGLPVLMQTTLFKENNGDIARFVDLAADLGAMALNFFFLVCTGRGVQQTDLSGEAYEKALADILAAEKAHSGLLVRARCAPYVRRMKGLGAAAGDDRFADWSSACLAGRAYLRIGPDGSVTPCPYIPNPVGSVRTTPLAEIWRHASDFQRLRHELPGGKCGDCDYRLSCGGCRARALASNGDLMAEDSKCGYVRPNWVEPEILVSPVRTEIGWESEALAMLHRIPAFVRDRVKRRIEERAHRAGLTQVTLDFVRATRPPDVPGRRHPN